MSDHHVVCSTVLSTLSSSFSAYFKIKKARKQAVTTKLFMNALLQCRNENL